MAVYPLLALLWAIVLVPPLVRKRAQRRAEFPEFDRVRLSRVSATETASHVRDDASPAPVRRTATQRRRRVLGVIGAGMVATLVVALVMRTRVAWGMHLLMYDVLIAYVGLLARARDPKTSRRLIAPPAAAVRPVLVPVTAARRLPRSVPFPTPAPTPLPRVLQAASR